MHNLISYYYQNKDKIWKVVLIISFLLGIIYYANYQVGKNNNIDNNTSVENEGSIYSDEENKTYISDKSAIYGTNIKEEEVEKINETISKFLQYCKNGNVEEAYNMLSKDCKGNEYKSLEDFKERYLKSKFNQGDIYKIENWLDETYKITISKDMLATGTIDNNKVTEYITIVEEDGKEKLNINGYIGKKEINSTTEAEEIKITVLSKKVYMDYEEYDFKVENLSNKTIKLDSLENIGTMYVETATQRKYNAQTHELYSQDLEIRSKHIINIKIKYGKSYSDSQSTEKLVFDNVILNYPEYKKESNKDSNNICSIIINM